MKLSQLVYINKPEFARRVFKQAPSRETIRDSYQRRKNKMAKIQPKFFCYWCKRELEIGEELQTDENNFYCKTCPEYKTENKNHVKEDILSNQGVQRLVV
jgi:hypothetical protein